ncbi:MAG TPA: YeeE/YedE family protein [Kofleriaceae bacterium]|nr:YeeE/YedE family protein [Kofleriaceae bacterium]
MHDFTPVHAAVGGALIALSLAVMLIATGRIAGLSGIVGGIVRPRAGDWIWRAWFLAGALAVGAVFELAAPLTYDADARVPLPVVAIAGLLVGLGTRLGNGCTSGHGLCGMSRLSKRSIVATMTFFALAVATATITGALCAG